MTFTHHKLIKCWREPSAI